MNAIRTVAIGLAIVVVGLDLPIPLLFAVVALEAGVGAFRRPLHMALLPAVATSPAQLVAANVTSSAAEGLGTFLGPAIAGILLVATGPLGATVATFLDLCRERAWRSPAWTSRRSGGPTPRHEPSSTSSRPGSRALVELPGPRLIVFALGLQTFVRGLLTVLVVVAAIELLGLGDPGVGALNAAMGLGGLIGAVAAITLAGRERLSPAFGLALAGWGAPIAVIGIVVHPVVALIAMAAVGVSNAFIDVSGFTLIQRMTPNSRRIAVLGLIDSVANGGVALGGVIAPVLIETMGIRGALVASGLILPVAAVLLTPALRRMDEGGIGGARRVELIRGEPLFAPLSLATVEHLAGALDPRRLRRRRVAHARRRARRGLRPHRHGQRRGLAGRNRRPDDGTRWRRRGDRADAPRAANRVRPRGRAGDGVQPGPGRLPGGRDRSRRESGRRHLEGRGTAGGGHPAARPTLTRPLPARGATCPGP